ncbi:Tyrosinase [Colletotrichum spinosum]|uniref:Tyrosinase n=1 Tax=Colletotrichum spinosum TaxID=1347390 RepID=A0A4R8Q0Q7_9PEZI|nr:Tyrosinase [Colletotrichum spinosum]
MPQGQVQDVFSDLKPFYANTSGAFWNAAMARDTLPFGYTYAETAPASGDGKPGNRAKLIASINKLYGLSSPSNLIQERARSSQKLDQFGEGSTGVSAWFKQPTHGFSKNADFASKVITGDNFYTEWIANIRVKNGALNGSFAIHLFLGEAPQEPTLWSTASNLVGSMNVFAMKNMGSGSEVSGTVPLTSALTHAISAGRLAGLDPAATEPYLRGCLEVRVAGETGAQVDVKSVTNLHIHIASARVRAAKKEWELPKWGPVTERFYFLN